MSLANTLSVLLNFKTDLSGLTKFTDGLRSRLGLVKELNDKLSNGAAAVNSVLTTAAGYLAVGSLKNYTAEALEARTAQAKLAQALQQTGQNSAAYRRDLAAQAAAMQQLTGVEDDQIVAVQRQLVFGGAQRKDIADFTALTLDFAAAKEIDVVAAAKAVGRALQGEGDELKRYGVVVDESKDKIAGLLAGLGKFKGQAGTAFDALPEGLREFRIASKEAQQAGGEAVIALSNPFLKGLAEGLRTITTRLDEVREHGSPVRDVLTGISSALGGFVGNNLERLALLAAGLLALKVGSYAASEGLKVLAAGFLVMTGQHLPQMIIGLQALSKEVGILQALSLGGWAGKLAFGLLAVGAALAAFAVGSVVIGSIEQAQLARLEREKQVRDVMWDQVKAMNQQIAGAKTHAQIAAAKAAADKQLIDATARIAVLQDKKIASEKSDALRTAAARAGGTALGPTAPGLSGTELAELDTLTRQLPILLGASEAAAKKTVSYDGANTSPYKPDEAQLKQRELEDRRYFFDVETAIQEAQADGNEALVEQLTRERDERKAINELGAEAYDLVQARLAVEAEAREQQRAQAAEERALFALETQALAAEAAGNEQLAEQLREEIKLKQYARDLDGRSPELAQARAAAERLIAAKKKADAEAERTLSSQLGALAIQRADIEANRYLTAEEKQAKLLPLLREENRLIAERIAALEREQRVKNDPARGQQIDDLRKQAADNTRGQATAKPVSMGEGILAGMTAMQDQIGSVGQMAARATQTVWQGVTDSIQGSLTGLITRTMTWGQALRNIGLGFGNAMVAAITKMGAEWAVSMLLMLAKYAVTKSAMFGLDALFAAKSLALSIAGAAKSLVAWLPSAIAASISSWGVAAAIGLAAVGAVLAFREHGGPVRAGQSYVVGERRAEIFTPDQDGYIYPSVAAGMASLAGDVGAGMSAPADQGVASGGGSGGGAADLATLLGDFSGRIQIVNVQSPQEAQRISRRGRAAGDVVRIVQDNLGTILRRGPTDRSS